MIPKLTASGKNLLLRALTGENITFTKIQLGNGPAQDPVAASALVNPILTVELSKIEVGQGICNAYRALYKRINQKRLSYYGGRLFCKGSG